MATLETTGEGATVNPSNVEYLRRAGDGTPEYGEVVLAGFRKLQYRVSVYADPPKHGSGIRLAVYQAQGDCGEGAVEKNMRRLEQAVKHAKKFDAQLISFPELYLPGYTLDPESARAVAEPKDGETITHARRIAKENDMGLILPFAEKSEDGEGKVLVYDAIAVIDETGDLPAVYRKTHLYAQQERDNWDFGESDFPVFRIHGFPVGVLNCYECEFPEPVRILALKGAKLIVGPTAADRYYRMPNGERSKVPYPDVSRVLFPAHAYANNLFFAYCNRCGYESRSGDVWHYRGNSIVCGPHGDVIVAANNEQDTLIVADCVPAHYGRTHPEPGYFHLRDRRPELYGQLVSREARFVDITNRDLDEDSDLFAGGYRYPDRGNGGESE
jgi:predicted amidohydrolase